MKWCIHVSVKREENISDVTCNNICVNGEICLNELYRYPTEYVWSGY